MAERFCSNNDRLFGQKELLRLSEKVVTKRAYKIHQNSRKDLLKQ